jgi:hypothetical protein
MADTARGDAIEKGFRGEGGKLAIDPRRSVLEKSFQSNSPVHPTPYVEISSTLDRRSAVATLLF